MGMARSFREGIGLVADGQIGMSAVFLLLANGFYGERDGGHTLDFGVAHGRNTQMFSTVARMILCIIRRPSLHCDCSTAYHD